MFSLTLAKIHFARANALAGYKAKTLDGVTKVGLHTHLVSRHSQLMRAHRLPSSFSPFEKRRLYTFASARNSVWKSSESRKRRRVKVACCPSATKDIAANYSMSQLAPLILDTFST